MPSSSVSKVRPSNRSGVCTMCPAARSVVGEAWTPGGQTLRVMEQQHLGHAGNLPARLQLEPRQPAPQFRPYRHLRAELCQDTDDPRATPGA